MKYFTFFILLLGCNGLFADMGFSYFYMKGKVFDIHNQPLRNEIIYFRDAAGEISRVKTDGDGVYRVRSNYILPCLSGMGKESRRKRAFSSNFPTISVYYKTYCDELPQQWNLFYFYREKDRKKEWAIQNIYLQSDCELITERINGHIENHEIVKNKLLIFNQFNDSTKFTHYQRYDLNRSYYEPLGLTESEFFDGLGIEKEGVYVDSLSTDKIVISFLYKLDDYSNKARRKSYTYIKKNGIIVEERVKYETLEE